MYNNKKEYIDIGLYYKEEQVYKTKVQKEYCSFFSKRKIIHNEI